MTVYGECMHHTTFSTGKKKKENDTDQQLVGYSLHSRIKAYWPVCITRFDFSIFALFFLESIVYHDFLSLAQGT